MSASDKEKLDGIAAGATANVGTVTGATANGEALTVDSNGVVDIGTVIRAHQDISGLAPKASPAFTGTPTAPTAAAGTDTTQVATTAFVNAAVAAAIGDLEGKSFLPVETLPATGDKAYIYLVPNGTSGNNTKDEYIWLATANKFEKVGSMDLDLSGYATDDDVDALTNDDIDAIFAEVFTA
jgi:hypothetical protein